MKFKPLHNYVLIRRKSNEDRIGMIFIPPSAQDKSQSGEVLAVGPGVVLEGSRTPCDVKPGDVVVFSKYGGSEVKIDGEDLVLIREDEIHGTIIRSE